MGHGSSTATGRDRARARDGGRRGRRSRSEVRGNLAGGSLGVVGAVLLAVGTALPWVEVGAESVAGWSASDDAVVLAGVAGAALLVAALVVGGARSLVLRIALGVLALVVLGVGAIDLASVGSATGPDPSPGIGLYLVLAAGVVLLGSAVLTRHR